MKTGKYIFSVLIFLSIVSLSFGQLHVIRGAEGELSLDKTIYNSKEIIKVTFKAPGIMQSPAWAGLVPADAPVGRAGESYSLQHQMISGKVTGEITFAAPEWGGNYQVRMHYTTGDGHDVATAQFQVDGPPKPTFTAQPQIAEPQVVPPPTEKPEAEFTWPAPADPPPPSTGEAKLELEKTVFVPGETIKLKFEVPPGYSRNAWIAIIPANVPHNNFEQNYRYRLETEWLGDKIYGEFSFTAPQDQRAFEFRLYDNNHNGQEKGFIAFRVE